MNPTLKWKLIAGFVLVFVAGAMTGAFAIFHTQQSFFAMHDPALIGHRMRDRLRSELNLTPEQVAKISPIVDKAAAQLVEIRKETGRRVHETMLQAHREIGGNLTDEQRERLKEMESRHRHWGGMHRGHPGPPEPPP